MLHLYSDMVDINHSTMPLELKMNGIELRLRETKISRNCGEFETIEFEIVDGKYY